MLIFYSVIMKFIVLDYISAVNNKPHYELEIAPLLHNVL